MKVRSVTDEIFEAEVLQADKPVLVDIWREGCKPCFDMVPIIKEVARELDGKVKVVHMNYHESPTTAEKYEIKFMPMLMLFRNGERIARWLGAIPKPKLVVWIERNLHG